jgi:UDP-N-acetylmuramoyl-L-alanyl-D-glutamate--2,6-diaminopimelate ligase
MFSLDGARQGYSRPRGGPSLQMEAANGLDFLMQGVYRERRLQSGADAPAVTALVTDSRRVVPGSLFFALPGLRTDGNHFVEEAIDRGAVAVVSEKAASARTPVSWYQVEDVRAALAVVARRFHDEPDAALSLTGITGTNGKTTVASLCQFLLSDGDTPVGLLGTVRYDLGRRTFPSYKTTPESVDLFALLDQMRQGGCKAGVLEVSSHGIDQKRVHGLQLRTAVFLNLTRDHLDYHGDMETYFQVKARLFTGRDGQPPPALAVINVDDPYGRRLVDLVHPDTRVIRVGTAAEADYRASGVTHSLEGSAFQLHAPEQNGPLPVASPLLGAYNVANLLAAFAVAHQQGRPLDVLRERLGAFPGVAGRMERVGDDQPFTILVDYAHTDDALRNAVSMLKPLTAGRLIVVFGCGGNRDRAKRPLMVRAVLDTADQAILTADNPRNEELDTILADMQAALRPDEADRCRTVPDRRQAIHDALELAQPGDCVLVAGKGHENFQEIGDTLLPFDDRQVVRSLLAARPYRQA